MSLFNVVEKHGSGGSHSLLFFFKEPAIPGHVHDQSRSFGKEKCFMGLSMPKMSVWSVEGGSYLPGRVLFDCGICPRQVLEGTNDGLPRLISF